MSCLRTAAVTIDALLLLTRCEAHNTTTMHQTEIVILDGRTLNPGDLSWAPFEAYGHVTVYDHTRPGDILERSSGADVLVVNKVVIDREIMEQLGRLRAICVTATGMNNIDLDAAANLNIPVFNVAGYGTESVAQHVFAFILHFANRIGDHDRSVQSGVWSRQQDFSYTLGSVYELSGKTLGIYGFGNIGKAVARIAKAFGMTVVAYTPNPEKHPHVDAFVPLESLGAQSDYVTLHARLSDENRGIIDKTFLEHMKRSAILINTGRGDLVNEEDLLYAIRNGLISGAGLDVLQAEPPAPDHPFFGESRIVITPHMAWAAKEARERLLSASAAHLAHIAG